MASSYENAKLIAELVKDKNRLKAQIAGSTDVIQIGKRATGRIRVSVHNVVATTRDTSADYVWNRSNWGVAYWDGTYTEEPVEVLRRRWTWSTEAQLLEGDLDGNIDVSQGDIRMG
jgi:hypothetical protein